MLNNMSKYLCFFTYINFHIIFQLPRKPLVDETYNNPEMEVLGKNLILTF